MRNIRNGDYMLRKLENEIVKECAPTLAGIKMANLFNYRFVSEDEFDSEIKTANMNLNEKGVYIEKDRYEFIDICIQTKYVI